MLMNNFLRDRKSTRNFKARGASEEVLERIRKHCKQINKEGYEFTLFQDGDQIFKSLKGIGGYTGVMIESPHYIAVNIKDPTKENIIYSAYGMEYLITELTKLNMGSCWVSLKDVDFNLKKEVFNIKNGDIDYILAIGYSVARNPFVSEPTSCRFSIEEIVYDGEIGKTIALEKLEQRALDDLFYYIRFAPSSYNRQPWRFILMDDKVLLLLAHSKEEELFFADAGIIMYYLENLAKAIGITSQWTLIDKPDYKDGEWSYKYIGEFKL